MSTAQTRKYLRFTLATGWVCLIIILLLSWQVLLGYFSNNTATGKVVGQHVYIEQIRGNGTPRQSKRHEITIQYRVADEDYWLNVNGHVYAALGVIEEGDNLTVVYSPEDPAQAVILSYALFSPMVNILGYVVIVCFFVGIPRWLLLRSKPASPA